MLGYQVIMFGGCQIHVCGGEGCWVIVCVEDV